MGRGFIIMSKCIVSEKDIKDKIKEYFARFRINEEIGEDQDLYELGLVHSLFTMHLILFIEKEFSIELDDEDLDSIKTINDIATLVVNKLEV